MRIRRGWSKRADPDDTARRLAVLLQCGNIFSVAATLESMANEARSDQPIDATALANRLYSLALIILEGVDLILDESEGERVDWH